MKMRNVMAAWIVIVMAMTTAAVAQRPAPARPMGPQSAMGMRGPATNCRVMIPNGARHNTLSCRCYVRPDGFNCMVLPTVIAARMDSMREERRDSMGGMRMDGRGRMRMGNDSMRMRGSMMMSNDSIRIAHRDSMMNDSLRAHRPNGRRP